MEKAGIRVEVDIRNEKLGYKIREAQLEKAPYMLVLGENEKNSDTVSVRKRGEGDLGSKSIQDIIEQINEEIISKR
ncbi:Threonine--tRNA ligase [compost metagenome]